MGLNGSRSLGFLQEVSMNTYQPIYDGEDQDELTRESPDEITDPDEGPDNSDEDE